ncbi:HNH endonuclease [Bradyrhizobium japonicum]|uniref:HNH endonuclease n=1 Tax=Bradyrhizobium japonicum TaxID=375 RepID=UPI001BA7B55C|nr:HNH endonuclease [Bradyrhizobium japonicum]
MADPRICSVDGCAKCVIARGWCNIHYRRWKKHGDPESRRSLANGEAYKRLNEIFEIDTDECVPWPYSKDRHGYGQIGAVVNGKRRPIGVHAIICEMANGVRPSSKHQAAHSCGNGHLGCCNRRHLRWATRSENEQDKARHGRRVIPKNFTNAKLTRDQVREIRDLYGKLTQVQLAQMFGVSQVTISNIVIRKTWTDLE